MAHYMDYIVSMLSVVTYLLTIKKYKIAFIVGISNQFFWASLAMDTHKYGLLISAGVFFCVNVYGLYDWTRNPPIKHSGNCLCVCDTTPNREAGPWHRIVRRISSWLLSGQPLGTGFGFRNLRNWLGQ